MAQPPQMLQISTEQLQQLVEAVRLAATSSASASAAAAADRVKSKANFVNCSSHFWGERSHEAVEEFITNVTAYKEIEEISDEDALKSVSLLFGGQASIWWQGIRKEAKTWNDVVRLVREHFSPTKPAFQIYMDIFNEKQDNDKPIDEFICEKRALLAQLPNGRHDEETELDLVYGLLNIKYRKYIARSDVKTFIELLERGRIVESNTAEDEALKANVDDERHSRRKRCSHCHFRGHTVEECRKRKEEK